MYEYSYDSALWKLKHSWDLAMSPSSSLIWSNRTHTSETPGQLQRTVAQWGGAGQSSEPHSPTAQPLPRHPRLESPTTSAGLPTGQWDSSYLESSLSRFKYPEADRPLEQQRAGLSRSPPHRHTFAVSRQYVWCGGRATAGDQGSDPEIVQDRTLWSDVWWCWAWRATDLRLECPEGASPPPHTLDDSGSLKSAWASQGPF